MKLELDSKTMQFSLSYFKVQDGYEIIYTKNTGTYTDKSDVIVLSKKKENKFDEDTNDLADFVDERIKNLEEQDYKEVKDLLLQTADEFENLTSEFDDITDLDLFYKVDGKSLRIPEEYNYNFDRIFAQ